MELLGIIGGMELSVLLFVILFIILFVILLPVIAVIDIVRSKFEGNLQLIWVLIVVFFSFIGSILYFFIGRDQKINDGQP